MFLLGNTFTTVIGPAVSLSEDLGVNGDGVRDQAKGISQQDHIQLPSLVL